MTTNVENHGGWRGNPLRWVLWAIPAGLLLTPAVAMQFSREVDWSAFDFIVMGVLLFGSAGAIDLTIRLNGSVAYRLGAAIAVLTSFLLVWINGAVGMIGNEDNPANLLFMGVIVIALVGSVIARFGAKGMARAMFAACFAQAAIAVTVLGAGWGAEDPPGTAGLVTLIACFAGMWLLAGGLFAKAARER